MSLRLDDYDPTLDAQADGDMRLVDHAGEQAMLEDDDSLPDTHGTMAACRDCGQPFVPAYDGERFCNPCFRMNKL